MNRFRENEHETNWNAFYLTCFLTGGFLLFVLVAHGGFLLNLMIMNELGSSGPMFGDLPFAPTFITQIIGSGTVFGTILLGIDLVGVVALIGFCFRLEPFRIFLRSYCISYLLVFGAFSAAWSISCFLIDIPAALNNDRGFQAFSFGLSGVLIWLGTFVYLSPLAFSFYLAGKQSVRDKMRK